MVLTGALEPWLRAHNTIQVKGRQVREHSNGLGERLPTEQDRMIYALLRPARLLDSSTSTFLNQGSPSNEWHLIKGSAPRPA